MPRGGSACRIPRTSSTPTRLRRTRPAGSPRPRRRPRQRPRSAPSTPGPRRPTSWEGVGTAFSRARGSHGLHPLKPSQRRSQVLASDGRRRRAPGPGGNRPRAAASLLLAARSNTPARRPAGVPSHARVAGGAPPPTALAGCRVADDARVALSLPGATPTDSVPAADRSMHDDLGPSPRGDGARPMRPPEGRSPEGWRSGASLRPSCCRSTRS